jgi:hypothetical protein
VDGSVQFQNSPINRKLCGIPMPALLSPDRAAIVLIDGSTLGFCFARGVVVALLKALR